MVTADANIIAKNLGPIQEAIIPYPRDTDGRCLGGIVLFKGPNNAGKSILTEAVDTLVTGRGRVEARDGTPFGTIEGLGLRLKAGAKNTRSGELEVHGLDGKFDMSDVVDPGIDDAAAADAKRIKALIQIGKAKADQSLFDELIGDNTELIKPDTFKSGDPVTMAARVKRDLEAGARAAETAAENANTKARALHEAAAGVDLTQPHDETALQNELEAALQSQAAIKQRLATADQVLDRAAKGREVLKDAETAYEGLTVQVATEREAEAKADVVSAETSLREAEEALRLAKTRHEKSCTYATICTKDRQAAEAHERNMAGWREAVAAAEGIDNPSSKDIADTAVRVENARAANSAGVLIRQAKKQASEALEHQKAGGKFTKQAERLRDAAKETDAVLSSVVAKLNCGLKVESGRLVMADGPQAGQPFARQSMGTRYSKVAPIAIHVLSEGDIFTLKQEAWEGLDWDNRAMLYRLCRQHRVVLYSAQCDAHEPVGKLRAELFEAAEA